jgi:hypothetical protein
MSEPIPDFYRIPIVDGKYSQVSGLFYTADLTPPGATYVAWLYTQSAQGYYIPVTSASSPFTVAADSVTPPTFTVNTPGAGSTPTPDQSNVDLVIPPSTYTLTGDVAAAGYNITGIGTLGAVTGTFSGTVTANAFVGGTVAGTTGTFSGAVSGTTGTFSGAVSGTTGTFSSNGSFGGTLAVTGVTTHTGRVGIGRSPASSYDLDVYKASGFTELNVENGGTADTGIIIKDSNRAYKVGINVAGIGAGKLTIHNVTAGASLVTIDDTKTRLFGGFNVGLTTYANNGAALAAGKVAGDFYTDGAGAVKVVF